MRDLQDYRIQQSAVEVASEPFHGTFSKRGFYLYDDQELISYLHVLRAVTDLHDPADPRFFRDGEPLNYISFRWTQPARRGRGYSLSLILEAKSRLEGTIDEITSDFHFLQEAAKNTWRSLTKAGKATYEPFMYESEELDRWRLL